MTKTEQQSVFFVKLPPDSELALVLKKQCKSFDSDRALPFLPQLKLDSDTETTAVQTGSTEVEHGKKASHTRSQMTREMITAGLLYIFAYDRENNDFAYYRSLFLELKPHALQELIYVADFQTKNFEFEEAKHILFALEGLYPDEVQVVLALALFYESRADFYRQSDLFEDADENDYLAESYYKAAISMEPPLPFAFFSAGLFALSRKNYAQARRFLNSYINLEDDKSPNAAEQKKEALKIVEHINRQKLDDLAYSDALNFIKTDENEKALSRIRDFLSEHPKSWNGWFVLGWALRKLERYKDARDAFLTALKNGEEEKAPDIERAYSDICNELSICYVNVKDFEHAKQWLNSALAFDCENIKLLSNLGMVYFTEGDMENAQGFFNTVLSIIPDDKTALYMLQKIENQRGGSFRR